MFTLNINNDKYTPAKLPEICAQREYLLAYLDQVALAKLIFISAPGGSGKTISTQLWIKKTHRKALFINLDAYDNSVAIFYRMFCIGILSLQPDNNRMTEILQDPAFYTASVEHTIKLLSEFILDESEYVLVLDDFHTITNQEILKSLPFILRRLPHSFIAFILSRKEPEEPLTDIIASRQAAVIRGDVIGFNTEEIKEHFISYGHIITDKEAETAFAFTGGWAVAVSALAQSVVPALKGFDIQTWDYQIKKLLWDEWDDSMRNFMTASAALDEMPVMLCEEITGRTDAAVLFERLQAQNAFITRVKDGVYRCRRLFLDFLRAQTEYTVADKKKSWRMAAEYYANEGCLPVASRYAYKSGNIQTILDIIYRCITINEVPLYEYADNLRDIIFTKDLNELCEKCPALYAVVACMAFLEGDTNRFEVNIDKLKKCFPEITLKYPGLAEAAAAIMALDYRFSPAEQSVRFFALPSAMFQVNKIGLTVFSLQMPFLHRSGRDYYELTVKKNHNEFVKIHERMYKNNYMQITHGVSAGLFLEQNKINKALIEAQASVSALNDRTSSEMRFSAYMHLAAVYLALEKETLLAALIEEIESLINKSAGLLRQNFLAFKARIKLWNGDRSAAREWLDHYLANDNTPPELYRFYQYFTTIRAYIVLGELERAKELAARIRQIGKDFRRPQDAAEAGVLLASVLWAEGRRNEAQEMMETVLSEMQPYSFIRLIADEGAAVLQVLKKVSGKTERADHTCLPDPVYVNSVYIAAHAVSKKRKGITAELEIKPVKLSKQQKAVIELLAQGYKRESIIEKTGLSLGTVKAHIRLAYEKLGAGNAADAVMKARELGIIQ